jgi:Pvc16 N-terminal domain
MSNSLAIATVTATLRNLLMAVTVDLPETTISTKSPRKSRNDSHGGSQINIFLYQTAVNAAWQKKQGSSQLQLGEPESLPLALNLYYLIAAYGRNDDDILSHQLLGKAMSILHEHPLLTPAEIKAALPGNDLHEQVEQIRITPQPLSPEDLSRLWSIFQAPYEISVAYQVSVVLMTCQRKAIKDPVINGSDNLLPKSIDPIESPPLYPSLKNLQIPNDRSSIQLGDILTICGYCLDGDKVVVRFRNVRSPETELMASILEKNSTTLKIQMPQTIDNIRVGCWTVAATITQVGKPTRMSNELPFSLAPRILTLGFNRAAHEDDRDTITLTCNPPIASEQQATLLWGDREIPADLWTAATDTLTFSGIELSAGEFPVYVVLRVDGIDSLPYKSIEMQRHTAKQQSNPQPNLP